MKQSAARLHNASRIAPSKARDQSADAADIWSHKILLNEHKGLAKRLDAPLLEPAWQLDEFGHCFNEEAAWPGFGELRLTKYVEIVVHPLRKQLGVLWIEGFNFFIHGLNQPIR